MSNKPLTPGVTMTGNVVFDVPVTLDQEVMPEVYGAYGDFWDTANVQLN